MRLHMCASVAPLIIIARVGALCTFAVPKLLLCRPWKLFVFNP